MTRAVFTYCSFCTEYQCDVLDPTVPRRVGHLPSCPYGKEEQRNEEATRAAKKSLKCDRCGASADFNIQTAITAISQRAEEALAGKPTSKTVAMCMGCVGEIGPDVTAKIESAPERDPDGELQ